MRTLDGTGLAKRGAAGRSGGVRRGPRAAALLGVTLLCCLFGPSAAAGAAAQSAAAQSAAPAEAAPAHDSAQVLLARMAVRQAQLFAWDGAASDNFGYSVAFSGETALVGAPYHDTTGKVSAGAAYVFTRSGGLWTEQAQLIAGDGAAGDRFGHWVALSGETALVGAPYHDTAGKVSAGAAYVFTRSGGLWTEQAQLIAGDGAAEDKFGYSVALSGETALVGAPNHATKGLENAGAAYVFTRSGGSWPQQAQKIAGDIATGDQFGFSVALFGETALVGAKFHDTAGKVGAGAAYVFSRSGGSWTEQAQLFGWDGAAGDDFGFSVALSGGTALIGAPRHDAAGLANAGIAYVFLTAPSITLFAPTAGPVGTAVTLTGTGFSGATAVTFNGTAAATFSVDSDAQVTAAVPSGATSGPIAVTTPGGTGTSAANYTVIPAPSITKLKPASGKRGATVTISGSGLGATRGGSSVRFGNKKCAQYVSWSDTQIKCKVPTKATYGSLNVTVKTAGGVSNAVSFTVKH